MTALQKLGEQLVELPPTILERLELPESLSDAIALAARINSHEGKRRQMQLIGKLMREVDPAPIEKLIVHLKQGHRDEALRQHAVERWRTRLLEDDSALAEFAALNPAADHSRIGRLVLDARSELDDKRPPRAQRELFRVVRDALSS